MKSASTVNWNKTYLKMLATSKNPIAEELSFSFYWLSATIVNKAFLLPPPFGGLQQECYIVKAKVIQ